MMSIKRDDGSSLKRSKRKRESCEKEEVKEKEETYDIHEADSVEESDTFKKRRITSSASSDGGKQQISEMDPSVTMEAIKLSFTETTRDLCKLLQLPDKFPFNLIMTWIFESLPNRINRTSKPSRADEEQFVFLLLDRIKKEETSRSCSVADLLTEEQQYQLLNYIIVFYYLTNCKTRIKALVRNIKWTCKFEDAYFVEWKEVMKRPYGEIFPWVVAPLVQPDIHKPNEQTGLTIFLTFLQETQLPYSHDMFKLFPLQQIHSFLKEVDDQGRNFWWYLDSAVKVHEFCVATRIQYYGTFRKYFLHRDKEGKMIYHKWAEQPFGWACFKIISQKCNIDDSKRVVSYLKTLLIRAILKGNITAFRLMLAICGVDALSYVDQKTEMTITRALEKRRQYLYDEQGWMSKTVNEVWGEDIGGIFLDFLGPSSDEHDGEIYSIIHILDALLSPFRARIWIDWRWCSTETYIQNDDSCVQKLFIENKYRMKEGEYELDKVDIDYLDTLRDRDEIKDDYHSDEDHEEKKDVEAKDVEEKREEKQDEEEKEDDDDDDDDYNDDDDDDDDDNDNDDDNDDDDSPSEDIRYRRCKRCDEWEHECECPDY